MRYCLNPQCKNRQNDDTFDVCQTCSNSLVINNRYILEFPLRELGEHFSPNFEIFAVQDLDAPDLSKVLKSCITDLQNYQKLFEQEAELLIQLKHPGIPKSRVGEYFHAKLNNGKKLTCLVMERIPGENLEDWLISNGKIAQDVAIDWLRQILDILGFVHKRDFFHRDIKPANIIRKPNGKDGKLVLIDFGTAREVTQTVVSGENVSVVLSIGYTAPEQLDGRAVPQSDFFALGRTFVHLVTGKHPNRLFNKGRLLWRDKAPQITPDLADLIDRLMHPDWRQRMQNTSEIQTQLDQINRNTTILPTTGNPNTNQSISSTTVVDPRPSFTNWKLITLIAVPLTLLLGGYAIYRITHPQPSKIGEPPISSSSDACELQIDDDLSCGEESLFPGTSSQSKRDGMRYFREGNYQQSINALEQSRKQDPGDPETLVYLNNARLASQNTDTYTIAIVLPLNSGNEELSKEALRGIAQLQDEINQKKINGKGLRVLIANDSSNRDKARKVSQKLVNKKDVLAVVGHYLSETTYAALPTYQSKNLVLISYGSTSTQLSNYQNVFFRVVPTTITTAQGLGDYLGKKIKPLKVSVFYNSGSTYSRSIAQDFKTNLEVKGGDVQLLDKLCINQDTFNAKQVLQEVEQYGAKAIALFPDGNSCIDSLPNTLALMRENNKRYPIVTPWGLSRQAVLNQKELVDREGLVLAHFWHRLDPKNDNSDFSYLEKAREIYGQTTLNKDGISGLSVLSYDAGKVLVTALQKLNQPNRENIRDYLAQPDFQTQGATGKISFNGSDRRENIYVLLKVVPSINCNNNIDYSFVPIDYNGLNKEGKLDCSKIK
jgi:ABC-type branched-subunit amino acid transport system substrate-binding protein